MKSEKKDSTSSPLEKGETVPSGKKRRKKSSLGFDYRHYIWPFSLSMLSGLAVLFFGHYTTALPDFDITCVRATSKSEGRIYDLDKDTNIITSRLLTKQPDRGRKFQIIEITDDPDHVYESTPPSPLDYAVMLHTLRAKGADHIVLTTRMSWDDDPGITADALSNKLADFSHASFAVPLTRGSKAQKLPAALRRSLIPFSRVSGNRRLLPTVNQVALPAVMSGGDHTYAGFSKIESTPEATDYVPMICQWQGEGIIPSLELLALMSAHNVRPEEVSIRCGKHIRLGLEGPVVPIDSYGETLLPTDKEKPKTAKSLSPIKAEALISQPKDTSAKSIIDQIPHVFLVNAVGEKTKEVNILPPSRLAAVITWSENLLAPEPGQSIPYRRLPLWAEVVIIFDIAFAACWFTGFTRVNRHLAFVLTAALTYPLLLSIMDLTQHWLSVSAPLVAILVAWLIPSKKRKHTTSIQAYHTADPKPVIRA